MTDPDFQFVSARKPMPPVKGFPWIRAGLLVITAGAAGVALALRYF